MSIDFIQIIILLFACPFFFTAWKFIKAPKVFSIISKGGTFTFLKDHYSPQELFDFQRKIYSFCPTPGKVAGFTPSYVPGRSIPKQSSGNGKWIILLVISVVLILVVGGIIFYFSTYCHVLGCGNEIYQDGYCKYHFTERLVQDTYNGWFGG